VLSQVIRLSGSFRPLWRWVTGLFLVWVSGCAIDVPPDGGPPDKTPPKILKVTPKTGTLNFKGNRIIIEFDKYITTTSLKPALFFSPALEDYEIEWSGKTAEIVIYDTLKPNRTYSFTLTQTLTDTRSNKIDKAYAFAFSTGSMIDSGRIAGKLFDESNRPASGIKVFAYLLSEDDSLRRDTTRAFLTRRDSLNPAKTKPDYVAQTSERGEFQFQYLVEGEYRLFAVGDKNTNFLYDAGESFAVPMHTVRTGMKTALMRLTNQDTTRIELQSVAAKSRHEVGLKFDRNLSLDSATTENFSVYDSTEKKTVSVYDYYANLEGGRELVYLITDALKQKNKYGITARALADKNGNGFDSLSFVFTGAEDLDTARAVLKPFFADSATALMERTDDHPDGRWLDLKFSLPVSRGSLDSALTLEQKKETQYAPIERMLFFKDGRTLWLKPKNGFELGGWYRLTVNHKKLRDALGRKTIDSVMTLRFQVAGTDLFGEIEGTLEIDSLRAKENHIVLSAESISDKRFYTLLLKKPTPDKTAAPLVMPFKFEMLPEGKYFLSAFVPMVENGDTLTPSKYRKWRGGAMKPFRQAERFAIGLDSVRVRRRWATDGVSLKFQPVETIK
jgi:Bacterial Ig-like domain